MDRRLTTAALVIGLAAAASPLSIAPTDGAVVGSSSTQAGPLVPPAALDPVLTPGLHAGLQARLDRLRAKSAIPGISAAILFPDGTVWRGSSGFANLKTKSPVTPETAFAVASVSKTFTSALILALCDEGRLRLGTSVASLLPALHLDPKLTVRQLLDHTSGLRDFFLDARIDKALQSARARVWTPARSLKYVGRPPYSKPGRSFHYSNTNYLLLGLVAERVDGRPLAVQLRTRFFAPLGLAHTYEQIGEQPAGPVAHGYRFAQAGLAAKAVDLSDGSPMMPFTSVVTAGGAAGSVASTPEDLVHWAKALYGGSVLAPMTRVGMLVDVAATGARKATLPYGLGVQSIDIAGRRALGHTGRLLGFRSIVRWLPSEGVAIAVLTNQSRTDPGPVAESLLRLALAPPTTPPAVPSPSASPATSPVPAY
jgi:D-alanyl-D-alanine carboxypeptidase